MSSEKKTKKLSTVPQKNNSVQEKQSHEVQKVEKLFNKLTSDEKKQIIAGVIKAEAYSGPIPRPEDFSKYDAVLPGAADRILQMAERQAEHRQSLEKAAVYSGVENSKRGQYFAFLLALVIIIGGIYLIAIDKDITGLVMVIGAVGTLAGIFIYGRKSEIKERKEKMND